MSDQGSRKPVGIKDVAAAAHVSWKTVSNVVNGTGRVGEQTRERVLAAIEELGYRPNLAGRQLRRGRTNMLALAVPSIDQSYFAQLAQAVIDAARDRGYLVFVEATRAELAAETSVAKGFGVLGIDGIIFSPLALTLGDVDELRGPTPMVLLGERGQATRPLPQRTDHVGIDNTLAAGQATRHLIETGRTRLAFLGRQEGSAGSGAPRELGFLAEMAAAGLDVPDRWMLAPAEYCRRCGAETIVNVLARIGEVDGMVCANDELALGAMFALRRNGVQVPQDLAIVGWDDTEDGRYSSPSLTTVAPDLETIAAMAVDRVIAQIEGTQTDVEDLVVPHRLLVRESSEAT